MYKKKNFILVFILTLILCLGFNIKMSKAATTTLRASDKSVQSGESFSVTITSSIKLTGWTISLKDSSSCTFISASGGEVNGKKVFGTSVDGTTNLATYKFKAPTVEKDTTYSIHFSGADMCDVNADDVAGTTCTAKITVKAKKAGGSDNSGSTTSNNNNTPKQPTFTSANKTVYTTKQCNLRSSWSTNSSATSVEKGTKLKLTGTSKETVNGYTWYRVQYKGATKYIASSLVTNTKPKEDEPEEKNANNNLSSLSIRGATLSPEFSKDVLQYTVQVEEDVTKLDIETKTENSKAKVEIQGNQELVSGENTIKIVVTAEDNTTKTYIIKALKGNEAVATSNDTLKLSKLEILGVSFDGGFDPDKYTYDLSLNLAVSNLTITAEPNQEDAKMEIVGNQDFKEGENLITIMLTSADGEQTATYQIKVNLPVTVAENKNDLQFYLICAAVALAVIVVIAIIVIVYHKRKNGEEEYQEEKKQHIELEEEKELTEVASKKETLDKFLDNSELEEKPKKTKGRHSV